MNWLLRYLLDFVSLVRDTHCGGVSVNWLLRYLLDFVSLVRDTH